ncbi:single-stranded-DNA-specific exonuclease RecJ [Rhodobacterales bacterium 52_120_T64]|nr:single-stranded-DNA-specific exonuclease RecJ [Rhodobacterales bacterium 52_120_T64]
MSNPAFLNVETSATGRRWIGPSLDSERLGLAISQATGFPPVLGQILANRNVQPEDAEAYMTPSLRELMPDPSSLIDMDKATERFLQAVDQKQRIAIFADYDVDGGSSAALLIIWLRERGINATLYIPDRIDEGYGPNNEAMAMLGRDHDLIVTVDCGTLSFDPIKAAGIDVIVLDHHLGAETLPAAVAVVNPNRQDESGDLSYLCAAAVVFLVLASANRALRNRGEAGPDLMAMLDLVALATVADVAPLIGFNRALVRQGLSVMANRNRVGLVALSDVARMNSAPSSYHLGYLLGPRINAGGRVGAADLGARLLSTNDPSEAEALAERLDALNTERRDIEATVLAQATQQAEERGVERGLVWAAADGWHPGVVGIVASRLKEAFNRPAVVIGIDGGEGKGSGRSVNGVDLGNSISTLTREGLLLKGGGHKMAAGLSISADKLDAAMERLTELLEKQGSANAGPSDLRIDGLISPSGANVELIEKLEQAGPFGASSPAPRFALASNRISFAKRAGDSHLRLTLTDGGSKIDAIAFRAFETELGPMLENHGGQSFHFAGRLEVDDWGGRRKAKLKLEDAAKVG